VPLSRCVRAGFVTVSKCQSRICHGHGELRQVMSQSRCITTEDRFCHDHGVAGQNLSLEFDAGFVTVYYGESGQVLSRSRWIRAAFFTVTVD
jgi:hypothetical protein